MPYVTAWAEEARLDLTVVGAHSPEFPFEHDPEKVRSALATMGIGYPVAVDNHFAIWRAFDNAYWPALYVVDAQERHPLPPLRGGGLRAVGARHPATARRGGEGRGRRHVVRVEADGVYLAADWPRLGSPETYVGYDRATGFASPADWPSTGAGCTPSRRVSG